MVTVSIQSLQEFLSEHQLKRVDGNILFNAKVNYHDGDTLQTVSSPVQVILLPNEMAVYILEFLKESYNITEMYSTGHYYFSCSQSKALEIHKKNENNRLLISIQPIQ